MTSILLALDSLRLNLDPEDPTAMACPSCPACLLLHQPDPELPDRLLGTCSECQAWFLIHAAAEVMVRLPGADELGDFPPASPDVPRSADPVRSATNTDPRP